MDLLQAVQPCIDLAGTAGLRNLGVHRYGDLLMEKVADAWNHRLDRLEAFVAALRRHAAADPA